jgi:hypothetical protein
MIDTRAPRPAARQGDARPAGHLLGRDAEVDRLRTFERGSQADGGTLVVTDGPSVDRTGLLDAASEVASAAGTPILRAARVEFDAARSSDERAGEATDHTY